jgi:hypothetical protein
MKTKHGIFFGFAVMLAAAVFTLAGCGNPGSGGGSSVTYTGTANGSKYELTITKAAAKAAYTPQPEDDYVLQMGSKISSGTVVNISGSTFILKPNNSNTTFTVTVSGNGLTAMTGTIAWDNSSPEPAPETLTPGGGGSGEADAWSAVTSLDQMNGTWKGSVVDATVDWYWKNGTTIIAEGKQTFSGEITYTLNAAQKSVSQFVKGTTTYSGGNIGEAGVWDKVKERFPEKGYTEYTVNDADKSISYTIQETLSLSDAEIAQIPNLGIEINQNGTKLKFPADLIDEGIPETIFSKQ